MLMKNVLVGVVAVAVMGVSATWLVPGAGAVDEGTRPEVEPATPVASEPRPADEGETKSLTGLLVDVHAYLVRGEKEIAHEESDVGNPGSLVAAAPIALVADDSTLVQKTVPGQTVYLIVFDAANAEAREAYMSLREQIGKKVAVSGQKLHRDGLHAMSIASFHPASTAAAFEATQRP